MPLIATAQVSVSQEIWDALSYHELEPILEALKDELQNAVDGVGTDLDVNLELSFD